MVVRRRSFSNATPLTIFALTIVSCCPSTQAVLLRSARKFENGDVNEQGKNNDRINKNDRINNYSEDQDRIHPIPHPIGPSDGPSGILEDNDNNRYPSEDADQSEFTKKQLKKLKKFRSLQAARTKEQQQEQQQEQTEQSVQIVTQQSVGQGQETGGQHQSAQPKGQPKGEVPLTTTQEVENVWEVEKLQKVAEVEEEEQQDNVIDIVDKRGLEFLFAGQKVESNRSHPKVESNPQNAVVAADSSVAEILDPEESEEPSEIPEESEEQSDADHPEVNTLNDPEYHAFQAILASIREDPKKFDDFFKKKMASRKPVLGEGAGGHVLKVEFGWKKVGGILINSRVFFWQISIIVFLLGR
jgi:hypothetical protein